MENLTTGVDNAFGPRAGSGFDFTLKFDDAVLNILPSVLMICATPIFIVHYKKQKQVILASALLWYKLAAAIGLFGIQIAKLVLWTAPGEQRSVTSIAASAVSSTAAICMTALLSYEHRYSMRSSAFLSLWLTSYMLFDGAIARSYFLRSGLETVAALSVATAFLKAALVVMEEWPKTHYVKDSTTGKPVGKEASSGFWNRALFLWLNKTLYSGYAMVISYDDLDPLDSVFDSSQLAEKFNAVWQNANPKRKHALTLASIRAAIWSCLSIIIPRLCLTFFMFIQPFFIQVTAAHVDSNTTKAVKGGIIGAGALIYLGVGISRSVYGTMTARFTTAVRGMLMTAILAKPFDLAQGQDELSATVTLMSTDIDGVVDGLSVLHEIWIYTLEFGLGLYFLSTMVRAAAFLVAIPTFVASLLSWYLAKTLPDAQKSWIKQIEVRVAQTSIMLSQLKALKMISLEDVASGQIQTARDKEIKLSIRARVLSALVNMTLGLCETMTPTLVMAGAIFWTTFTDKLTPIEAFKTIALITLVSQPLRQLVATYSRILPTLACSSRVQNFLVLGAIKHSGAIAGASPPLFETSLGIEMVETGIEQLPEGCAIRFTGVSLRGRGQTDKVPPQNVTLSIQESELVMFDGPTACGKTVFARALTGESEIVSGSLSMKPGTKGYCGQNIWIKNGSIKDNIIGFSPFDEDWYNAVVEGFQLKQDFRQLPDGDQSSVGSTGVNLSGGQKQRIAAARAIYSRAKFLILDDIFSALDILTANAIFNEVFGSNGLIRSWHPTVILVTHSVQFYPYADRVALIDSDGNITVKQYEATSPLPVEDSDDASQETSPSVSHDTSAQLLESITTTRGIEDSTRQRGDFKLYLLFLQTIGAVKTTIWFALTVATAVIEKFPDVLFRIWLDRAPENKLFFTGYALTSAMGCITGTGMIMYWYSQAVPASLHGFHQMLLDAVMGAKLPFLMKIDHGTLVSYFSQDITMASRNFPQIFMRFVYVVFLTMASTAVILSATSYAAPLAPVILAAFYYIQRYYLRTSRQIRHLDLESKEPLYTHMSETIAGLEYIRGFGWEQATLDQGIQLLDNSQKPFYHMFAIQRWLTLVIDLVSCGIAVVLLTIAQNVHFTASEASLALALVSLILYSDEASFMIQDWTRLETALGAIARLQNFIKTAPREDAISGDEPADWPIRGQVSFHNVVAKYDDSKPGPPVLDGIDFQVPATTVVGIKGRTGSGKSSMLLAILNFLDYTGRITIDNIEISSISPRFLRSRVGNISQDGIELDGTLRFNLCPWTLDQNDEERQISDLAVAEMLWRLGLWETVVEKGGLDVKMSKLGLSQGQKQLMGIIRCILRREATGSRLLLVDEATSNLDEEMERTVHLLIREKFKHCTIFVVSHREKMLKGCNLIAEMQEGKLSQLTVQPVADTRAAFEGVLVPIVPLEVGEQLEECQRKHLEEMERIEREAEEESRRGGFLNWFKAKEGRSMAE